MVAVRFPAVIVPLPTGPASERPPAIRAAVPPDAVTESYNPVDPDETIVVVPFAATLNAAVPDELSAEIRVPPEPDAVFCNCNVAPFVAELVALIAEPALEETLKALFTED